MSRVEHFLVIPEVVCRFGHDALKPTLDGCISMAERSTGIICDTAEFKPQSSSLLKGKGKISSY